MEPGIEHQVLCEDRCSAERCRVSILLVNFRAYTELTGCLASLEPLVNSDLEAIVVDHDTDPAAAAALCERFPWARVIGVAENPGFAAGVNRAARAATGHYLLLLNPDSVVSSDLPRALAGWLDQHPRAGVCGALVREPNGAVQASARRFPGVTTGFAGRTSWLTRAWPRNVWTRQNLGPSLTQAREPTVVDWVSGACMMVRREAFDAVAGMDEKFFMYWEDADFCARVKRAGWQTVYNPLVEVVHLTGRSSVHVRRAALIAFHRSAYRYFRKHGGWRATLFAPAAYLVLQGRLVMRLSALRLSARRHANSRIRT
jgi:GT2 family glycosyltransferase